MEDGLIGRWRCGLCAAVVVLGRTVANTLFADGRDPVGQYVLLRNVPFLVI